MKATTRHLPLRCILTLATVLGLGLALASPPAGAAETSAGRDPARTGLYGAQDPTYDGVYRQGLTILALTDAGAEVDRSAIQWLRRQQCGNGRWTSFRSDLGTRCGPADSNATAVAVMALTALGRSAAPTRGLEWLVAHQQVGGGWEYSKGWGADANSTGLVVQALIARGVDPQTVTNGGSGLDFLASVQLGCSAAPDDRGALAYLSEDPLVANDYATAQATQA
ncbi:MAG: terpene cyclase/mutase family protein, partial [Actinomycetota bacterium]|nr:terpene cyclase/mutase family protein [Actinomycetota bacterium]